jgi:hypothetical protein
MTGPAIGFNFVRGERLPNGSWRTNQFFCRVLEIQTITRSAALGASNGIGFYFNGQLVSFARERLVKIGEALLKSGIVIPG